MTTNNDNFSSDNWVDNDPNNIRVTNNKLKINCKRDGTNDASVYDLGTGIADNWTLKFEMKVTNVNSNTQAGNGFYVGLSDSDESVGQADDQDFVGIAFVNDNTDKYSTSDASNSALGYIWQGDNSQSTTLQTNSRWYVKIVKTGNSYTCQTFSESNYSTGGEGEISGTCSVSGLRYIKVLNSMSSISTSTTPFEVEIDDLEFTEDVDDQQIRVWFYPTNNVQDTESESNSPTWKWWIGMRGKRRYGKRAITRVRL